MNKLYSSLLNRNGLQSKSNEYSSLPGKARTWSTKVMGFALLFFISLLGSYSSKAQTVLINPATDGGFESGATFAANGWTVNNSENNPWIVAPLSDGAITGNAAFISENGTTPSYLTTGTCSNYFWRDVTVPAGESKIQLQFNWTSQGENNWDIWQVFVAPTSVTPVSGAHPGSGAATVPPGIAGATYVANGSPQTGVQTVNVNLPTSLAGTTFRLIFHWKSDTSTGTQPPTSIDNISLTSGLPGNYTSIASGNWSSPTTWDSGLVPSMVDNATIAAGHTVVFDALNQTASTITVNGTLEFSTVATTLVLAGNLTVNTGGIFNVFKNTTGKTVTLGGNLINNGEINLSVGVTSNGVLILNGGAVQTVSGSGMFTNNVIRNLTITNTSLAIPNIQWQVNNVSVEYNLSIGSARFNLGSNKLTHGVSTTIHTTTGTFSATTGGFMNGAFSRWWNATATGYTTLAPTSIPTSTGGKYPFLNALGQLRILYLGRTLPTAGGQYAVKYTDDASLTSGLSLVDGAYTVTDRFNGKFEVTTQGTTPATGSYIVSLFAPDAFYSANGNGRVIAQNAAISGTHQNTFAGAAAQRSAVSEADLLNASGLFLGLASDDILFTSVQSGPWNSASTWNKGVVPACSDGVVIGSGHTITSSAASNISKSVSIALGGTLAVTAGDLTVGCTLNNNSFVNNGTLTVSGGILNVNGNFFHNANSTFNQSGGAINVDGNDGGILASSVASGTAIVQMNTNLLNLTGGTLTIVDPHAAIATSNSFTYLNANKVNASGTHVIRLGNGTSTDLGGNVSGFRLSTWQSSGQFSFNDLIVNGGSEEFRKITTGYGPGINGNLTITTGSQYVDGGVTTYLTGNLVNNGTYINTGTLYLGSYFNGVAAVSTMEQSISGTGVFANLATVATANLKNLTVRNTNALGVTLNVPLSISGTLNMITGVVNTTSANLLTVGTPTATATLAITPSATNMINGPLARTIAASSTANIVFPVGKSVYMPIAITPTTTAISVFKAEAFNTNTGTVDASLNSLAGKRWEVSAISGAYTDINVKLTEDGITAMSIPVQGTAGNGVYSNAFGSVATYDAGPPPTTTSSSTLAAADFTGFISYANSNVCMGTPAPGNTIASATSICLGESVTLSLENTIAGTGVTYLWKSSTDGVVYTPIADAVGLSLTVMPSAATYYIAEVTCAAGPSTGTSTAVFVSFTNSITTSTPGTRCGEGSVALAATAAGTGTVKWYATPTGGASLGSGESFATPSIATSTTFYAGSSTAVAGNVTIGTGTTLTSTTQQNSIFCNYWATGWRQMVYTAAELNAAGLSAGAITSVAFTISSLPITGTVNNFAVRLGTAASATVTTTFATTGLNLVFGPVNYTPTLGANTLTFATPYMWDGVSNVLVDIREDGGYSAANSATFATNTAAVSVVHGYSSSSTPTASYYTSNPTGTTTTLRPNAIFSGQLGCSSARVAVLASVTVPPVLTLSDTTATICKEATSSAIMLTSTVADYDTYVWSPAEGVSGDSTTGWSFNPLMSTIYTLTASQTTGSLCATSVTVDVTVNVIPSAITFAPIASGVCVDAITPLSFNGGTLGASGKLGSGVLTNTTSTPFKGYWGGIKTQSLYTAAELTALGMQAGQKVSSIGYVSQTGTPSVLNNFTIKAGFVSTTTLGASFDTGASTVVLAPSAYTAPTGTGNLDYTLATPLLWDGVSNLLVETCFNNNNGGGISANSLSIESSLVATGLHSYLSADNNPNVCSSGTPILSTTRPNLRITAQQITAIVWSPTTNLFSDAAATVAYVNGNNASTVYFKSSTAGVSNYTVTATTELTCSVSATTAVNVIDCGIPYANLQFPGTATVGTCTSPTYYAQVYKEGVTEAAGQGAGITAWIGKNTANTDPATWSEASWQLATYNVSPLNPNNNDEYQATFSPLTAGTYYVASRFVFVPGQYVYGGYAATGGGIWNGTTNLSGVLTVETTAAPTADAQTFCNVGTVADLVATGTDLQWYGVATGGTALMSTTALASGNYYVSQTLNSCESVRTMVAVTLNVTPEPAILAMDPVFCGSATIANLSAAGTNLQWYAAPTGGTALASTTALATGSYFVSQTIAGCESARNSVSVTVNVTDAPTADAQTFCNAATVADLMATGTGLQWYADATGGTALVSTTALASGNYYVSQTLNSCESPRAMVSVTLNPLPTLVITNPVATCGMTVDLTAAAIVTGSDTGLTYGYWADPSATVTFPNPEAITSSGTFYIKATNANGCFIISPVVVTINFTGAPTGTATQDFTLGQTLADFTVVGQNLVWYSDATGSTVLPSSTLIVSGVTYYATQTLNGCESTTRLAVTAGIDLRTPAFEMSNLRYYPNPVQSTLTVEYSDTIEGVQLYNMLGQQVYSRNTNASKVTIEMTSMAAGNYILQVTVKGITKNVKVIKQ